MGVVCIRTAWVTNPLKPQALVEPRAKVEKRANSGAPAAQRVVKQSIITIGSEPHACIEIGNYATLSFMVTMASDMDRGFQLDHRLKSG